MIDKIAICVHLFIHVDNVLCFILEKKCYNVLWKRKSNGMLCFNLWKNNQNFSFTSIVHRSIIFKNAN